MDPVRCLGILEQINGGQPWEVEQVVGNARHHSGGVMVGLDEPVESDGPWRTGGCGGTVRARSSVRWGNIRFLTLSVDMGSMEITRYAPNLLPSMHHDQPTMGPVNWLGHVETHNVRADNTVYQGPALFAWFGPGSCPRRPGYRD